MPIKCNVNSKNTRYVQYCHNLPNNIWTLYDSTVNIYLGMNM